MSDDDDKHNTTPHIWVSSTYFAEGFPYAIVHQVAEVLFKEMGASLQAIGLTALFHLPWNLKFLWGPFLDAYGTKRKWLIGTEIVLCIALVCLAFSTTMPAVIAFSSVVFFMIAFTAATHDIAIDGYYLESLDSDQQSQFVGYRATAYKLAMLIVSGPLLMSIAFVGWFMGLLVLAVVMGLILATHLLLLPETEEEKRPLTLLFQDLLGMRVLLGCAGLALSVAAFRLFQSAMAYQLLKQSFLDTFPWLINISLEGWIGLFLFGGLLVALGLLPLMRRRIQTSQSFYAKAFIDFLDQPKVGHILAFVILFRAGESLLLKMRYPFFTELGMTLPQFSLASGTIGIVLSFSATLLGGFLISKHSLRRWIWPFVLLQNSLNLLFAGLGYWAATLPEGQTVAFPILAATIGLESFGSGLGTAVFMVYLMRCCRPEYKAAHMAIVTALMSLSFTLAGVTSGFLANWLGFGHYFLLSFIASIPGMMLIPLIPHLHAERKENCSSLS